MAQEEEYFKSPGHYVYDGIIYQTGIDAPILDRINNGTFQLHEDDVLVSSYPKAGTSWAQSIVSLICNADDLEATSKIPIEARVPFLEFTALGKAPLLDAIEKTSPPRLLKTHLPARFFLQHANMTAKKTKTVYVMRNPKDTLVSYYHFYRMNEYFGCFKGTWSEFFELFKHNRIGLGNWFDMVLEWWSFRDRFNIHFVKYEDLKKDPKSEIQGIADYLGKPLREDQLNRIVELTTFTSMRKEMEGVRGLRSDISPFMRKGESGDWTNYFTPEQNAYFDELYKSKMTGTGLDFEFLV